VARHALLNFAHEAVTSAFKMANVIPLSLKRESVQIALNAMLKYSSRSNKALHAQSVNNVNLLRRKEFVYQNSTS
jgi:hypothetical protein